MKTKNILLLILGLVFSWQTYAQCTFKLTLSSANNTNGWSNALSLSSGSDSILAVALGANSNYAEYEFEASTNDIITTSWDFGGAIDTNMVYTIFNNAGMPIATANFPDTVSLTATCLCISPTMFNATDINQFNVVLNWLDGGDTNQPATLDLEIIPVGATRTGTATHASRETGQYYNSFGANQDSFIPDTYYEVYARPLCAGTYDWEWVGQFKTNCPTQDLYYYEDYQNILEDQTNCWTFKDVASPWNTLSWYIESYSPAKIWCGTAANPLDSFGTVLTQESAGSNSVDSWAFSHTFMLQSGHNYKYSMNYIDATIGANDLRLNVFVTNLSNSPVNENNADLIYTDINFGSICNTMSEGFQVNYDGNYHIALQLKDDNSDGVSMFDRIYLRETSSAYYCAETIDGEATNITETTATLTWEEEDYSPLSFDLKYGLSGFDVNTIGTEINGITLETQNLTGLTGNTNYDFYIKTNCTASMSSYWSGPYAFKTLCPQDYSAPYLQNFDNSVSPELDQCWSVIQDHDLIQTVSDWQPNYTSPNVVDLAIYANDEAFLISPMLSDFDNNKRIEFYLNDDDNQLDLVIGTMSDPTDSSTFTAYSTILHNQMTDDVWEKHIYDFTTYSGTDKYIALKPISYASFTGYKNIYVDNFYYMNIPTCLRPINLAVSTETINGADLSWTEEGSATLWDLYIIPEGTAGEGYAIPYQSMTPTVNNVTNPYTWTDGAENTSYDFYVRADCSGDNIDTSLWVGPFTFTTLDLCDDPSNGITTEITTTTAKLGWTENGTATTWNVEYRLAGDTSGQNFTTSDNPHLITSLSAGTNYEFYVSAFCNPDESNVIGPFYFTTLPNCTTPTDLTIATITNNGADLGWTANGAETHWDIYITDANNTEPISATIPTFNNVTNNPYTWSNGLANTDYKFYVRADCGQDDTYISDWSFAQYFTTNCNTLDLPYEQDFEMNNDCWTEQDVDNDFVMWSTMGFDGCTAQSTGFSIDAFADLNDWLYSPGFVLETGIDYTLDFSYSNSTGNSTSEDLVIYLVDANNPSANIESTILSVTDNSGNCIDYHNATFTVSTNGTYYVAFYAKALNGAGSIAMDNFLLMETPSCPKPSNLDAQNITNEAADLSWTNNSTATSFNVEYLLAGLTPNSGNGTMVVATSASKNITGLDANTDYDFYVQAICDVNDLSTWSGPYTFTTLCSFFTVGFSENFDNSNPGYLPDCWSKLSNGYGNSQILAWNNPNSNSYHLNMLSGNVTTEYQMVITPEFSDLISQENQIRFYAKAFSSGSNLEIGTISNISDNTTFNSLTTITLEDYYQEFTYVFDANYTATDTHIAFKLIGTNPQVFIDDFIYEKTPPCPNLTTWNGTVWDNGLPDATLAADILVDYNGPSFTCCQLTVTNSTLTISDGNYVEVMNDVVIDGNIFVENGGSLVQRNDDATVTGSGSFTTEVDTSVLQDTNRFTYFSSPVVNTALNNAFSWGKLNYLWEFNGSTQHWSHIPDANTIMNIGAGYAVEADESGVFPKVYTAQFNGFFNNGIIQQPLYFDVGQQESNATNDDSNLVGNPYPSAISADMLINNNNIGAVYIWDHHAALDETTGYYENDDYIICSVGNCTNGHNGILATGQGFFALATANGTLEFNNAMRLITNNALYRTTIQDKLWLNITSNQGHNNQLLVAFTNNGTSNFDEKIDALRLGSNYALSFYSLLDNDDHLAINDNGLFADNITIPLGYYFNTETLNDLTISIDSYEGLEDVSVYLIDNLLDITHDLRISDYTFTVTDTGEFNDRFEITFNRNALNIDDLINKDKLIITNESETSIIVKMINNSIITEFKVYDMLGKLIINKKPSKSNFIVKTPNLKQGNILLIKAKLENGKTVFKKFIKY